MAYVHYLSGFSLWNLTNPVKFSLGLIVTASGLFAATQAVFS